MVEVKVGRDFKSLRCGRDWGNVLFIEDFVICEMWQYCRCVVFWSRRRFCIIEMRWGLDGRCWGSCRFYICEMWQRHMRCSLKISHLWGEAEIHEMYVEDFAFVRWGRGRAGRCCLTALLTVDPITTGSIQFPGNLAVLLWDEPPPPYHHHHH